jgi:hypothetical protein
MCPGCAQRGDSQVRLRHERPDSGTVGPGSIRRIVGDGRSHSSGREVGNQLGAVTGVGGRATDERGFPEVGLEPALFVEVTHVDQRRDGLPCGSTTMSSSRSTSFTSWASPRVTASVTG